MKYVRTRVALAIAGTATLVYILGCASLQHDPRYDGVEEQEPSRCSDACFVLMAQNNNWAEARTYINGRRVALLPAMMIKPVPIVITRWMLDGAGCLVVFVQLFPDNKAGSSSRECPAPGSRLTLSIEESYGQHPLHVWLTAWRA